MKENTHTHSVLPFEINNAEYSDRLFESQNATTGLALDIF